MAAKNQSPAKRTGSAKTKKAKPGKWVIANAKAVTRSKGGQIAVTIIAAGALGTLAYFAYKHFKKKKNAANNDVDAVIKQLNNPARKDTAVIDQPLPVIKKKTSSRSSSGNDDFPLKKGSKGDKVKQLQQALIAKYGAAVLPKYGADGDFGGETAGALKKNNLPQTIDESTFNVLVDGQQEGADLNGLGKRLYEAADSKNLSQIISLLKSIKNKEQYQQVSTEFSNYRLRGVHQTLVNGLLGTFKVESQKQQIRLEFLRMGLQYNGNKWSLSGFDGKTIVTVEGADVWVTPTQSVQVPPRMVLGNEVAQRLDYTLFENNDKYFLVKSKSVKYL